MPFLPLELLRVGWAASQRPYEAGTSLLWLSQWGHGSLEGRKLRVMVLASAFPAASAAIGLSVLWDLAIFCLPDVPALPSHILGSQVCPGKSQSVELPQRRRAQSGWGCQY